VSQTVHNRISLEHLIRMVGILAGTCAGFARADAGVDGGDGSGATLAAAVSRTDVEAVQGRWTNGAGCVVWRTGGTWGMAGFHVYRVDSSAGAETRLTETLVPVAFHDPAAAYAVVDPAAVAGGSGRYRLEETTLEGATNDLGTHAVVFAPAPAGAARPAPRAKSAPRTVGTSPVLKVRLRNEGIYGIDLAAIASGLGIAVEDAQDLAAANGLRVTLQGAPVPTLYDAARARLAFYGQASTNWYARDNVYLVSAGAGSAMPRREPGATQGTSAVPAQVRGEEDVFPFDGALVRPADFYYWNFVISTTNPASNQVAFALDLPGHDGGAWTLKVDVQGWSKTTARNPDHCAEFRLNGSWLGSLSFDDQNAATAVLAVPAGVASNGTNVLTVRGAVTNASHYSYFVVDGATAEYRRDLAASVGPAQVRAGGAADLAAAAFAEPLVLALDAQGAPTWVADANGQLPDKAWAAATTNERFAVIEADAVPLLAPEPAAADAWFLAETNRIDYLVVAPRALTNAVQELADYRAGQGLRVGVAVFEDACDLLAGGLRTPEAIPALVRRAATTWAEAPRLLLLAGNGHYDYLETMGTETNFLPPLLRQNGDGLFAADELLADAGGDERPDVAVGRLPACSAEELAAMIAKIEAYEADFGAAWQNQLAFANDKADAAGNFAASVAQFTNRVQNPFAVSARIDLDTTAIAAARAALFAAFDAGAGVVHYSGHGTSVKWNSLGLLTTADVEAMTNARTPFVASLCCLAGHFEAPAVNSLAERLMQRPQAGAVAVWASSALPLNAPATDLGDAFYRGALQDRAGPLGRVLLQGRRSLPGDLFTRDSYATYNLLGDPALRLLGNGAAPATNAPAQVFLGNLAQACDFTPRAATATTMPAGLALRITYAGRPEPPTLPGGYAVTATVATAYWEGQATGTLVVAKAPATVVLDNLEQVYDGAPRIPTATTAPAGLPVRLTYSGATNPPTAAGNYWVVATVDDPTWAGAASGILAVAKAPAMVALGNLAQVYDGAPKPAEVAATPTGLVLQVTYNGATDPPTTAGAYVVTAQVVSACYAGAATGTLVVAKAPATIALQGLEQTYDGTRRVVTATTVPDELAVDIRYAGAAGAPTNAGAYAVSGTVSDPNWQGSATGTLVVAPGVQAIDFPPLADQWTTNVVTLAATASSGLPVTYAVAAGPAILTDDVTLAFMGSGTVAVAAFQAGDANWQPASNVVRSFAVAYRLPIPEVSASRVLMREGGAGWFFVRLRSRPAANVAVSVARAWGSTNLAVQSGAALTFKKTDWNVFQTVTLAAATNGAADCDAAVFRISAAGMSDVLVTARTLDDGLGPNRALAANGATISGYQAADAALAIDGVATSGTAHAAVIWTSAPSGHLLLDLPTTTAVECIHVRNGNWSYGPQRYRIEGSRDGANWTLLADAGADDHEGWDEWPVAAVARHLRLTAISNATGAAVNVAEWEVYGEAWSPAPAAVALSGLEPTYDGTPKRATATTDPPGLAVECTYDGSTNPPTTAGSYAVVAQVTDPDYEGSATGMLRIGRADQTIDFPAPGNPIQSETAALAATAASGLPVSFAVVAGPGAIENGTNLAFAGAGDVRVAAMQAGDANWNAAPAATQAFRRLAVAVDADQVRVRENGEGRFFVRLSEAPTAAVAVAIARAGGTENLTVQSGATLSFTAANWDAWQAVVLGAGDDADAESEEATFQVAAPGLAAQAVAATTLDDDVGENLALSANGGAVCGPPSSHAEQAADGMHVASTNYAYVAWTSAPPGALVLQLRAPAVLSRIRVLNWDWVRRTQRYRLEASTDGATWRTVADAGGEDHRGWDEWTPTNEVARYLRFVGLSNSASAYASVAEWEAWGTVLPGPLADRSGANVRENGEGRFFVRLAAEPTGTVAVAVSFFAGDTNLWVKTGATRSFTPANWNAWQAVTLAAGDDANAAAETATFRIAAPGAVDQFVTATALDDDLGENLALASGGATIAGTRAYQAAQTIDGVHTSSANYAYTVWTNDPPGTLTLDLQAAATVSRVRLLGWDWTYQTQRYRLESSLDGANWLTFADAGGTERHGWDDWGATNAALRYLRFVGLTNSAGVYQPIAEWEVYGERPPMPGAEISEDAIDVREAGEGRFFVRLTAAPAGSVAVSVAWDGGSTNLTVKNGATRTFTANNWNAWQAVTLAAGDDAVAAAEAATFRISAPGAADQFVIATTLDDDVGENLALAAGGATIAGTRAYQMAQAIDGVHTSSVSYGYATWTNDPPGTLTLDLQAEMDVTRVRLLGWDWVPRVQRYRIDSSPDGTNWLTLADASGEDHHGWDDWPATNGAIRYLRFVALSNSANAYVCVAEWEVWGTRPPAKRIREADGLKTVAAEPEFRDDPAPFPLAVATSDDGPEHTNGWAAVDGDTNTLWAGRAGAEGWYVAVSYDAPLVLTNVAVDLAEGSLARFRCLYSLDGADWREWPADAAREPVEASVLWLLFRREPGVEAVPRIIEIVPQLQR